VCQVLTFLPSTMPFQLRIIQILCSMSHPSRVDPSGFRLGKHASRIQSGMPNAILNGLEVIKMSNYVGSLDGLFGVDGSSEGHRMKIVAGVGLAMVVTALLLLVIVYIRWPKGPQDWEKQNSRFSSWPFPLRTSHCSFLCWVSWILFTT